MLFRLLQLELQALLRSKQLKSEALSFVFKLFLMAYFALALLGFSFLTLKLVKDFYPHSDAMYIISGFFIFYWLYDLLFRFALTSSPVINIKPLLFLNIKQRYLIQYALFKAYFKFINVLHLFYFIPLAIILVVEGYSAASVGIWTASMLLILSCNSFVSIFIDKIRIVFYVFVGLTSLVVFAHFNGWVNVLPFTAPLSLFFFQVKFSILVAFLLLFGLVAVTYRYYSTQLYLDKALKKDEQHVRSLNFKYLTSLGAVGTFIKNDLYLIIRNKRPRTTILMSLLFIFYPFILIDFDKEINMMAIFAAIFASGGFMISFGQYVPSWDSAHYPLFMTQNVSYREYLLSKWYIMCFACVITLILCSFYLFLSPVFFCAIIAATIFNIGFNSNVVLYMGTFMHQSIDLTSNSGAFGNTKSFNVNTLFFSLIILLVPLVIQIIFQLLFSVYVGLVAVAAVGCIGFLFREKIFAQIVKKYTTNKYQTLKDFKN